YDFRDAEGRVIDSSGAGEIEPEGDAGALNPRLSALETLEQYLRHFSQQPSPHRGWEHRLEEVAATMEAMSVSHRTGQAEAPGRGRRSRRRGFGGCGGDDETRSHEESRAGLGSREKR